jgi:hypothetical protein
MKIKTEIMFKLLKLVKKTGILQELKSLLKGITEKNKKDLTPEEIASLQEEVGMDILIRLISNLDNAENEFYDLIAGVKEIDVKQAKGLEFDETVEILKAIFASEVFKGFLSSLSK